MASKVNEITLLENERMYEMNKKRYRMYIKAMVWTC